MLKTSFHHMMAILLFVAPWSTDAEAGRRFRAGKLIERTQLSESVFHDVYVLRIGNGTFDTIRVHRVARVEDDGEGRRRRKRILDVDTEHAAFLIHGAGGTFSNAFLAGTLPSAENEDQSLAVFLAKRDIDVWGLDLAWSLVPFDTEDLSFMADWGLQRQIDEVRTAIAFAQWRRRDDEPMHVLGYSLGGLIGYALVNEDAGLACDERQVKGWIPLDTGFQNPASTEGACRAAAANDARLANGVFRDGATANGVRIGSLALSNPGGPSPFAPGLTNRQFGLVVAAAPQPIPPPSANNPFYHFFAGVFDTESGLPVDLAHVPPSLAFEWLQTLGGGPPIKTLSDGLHLTCGDIDQPFDDFLAEVTVPVLYVGVDGGFGDSGVFATSLLGSSDVTIELVDLVPDNRLLDYGHIDVGIASNAGFLAWEAIASWIRERDDDACDDDERALRSLWLSS